MLKLVSSKPFFHLAFWHQAGFFIDKKSPNLWPKKLLAITEPKQALPSLVAPFICGTNRMIVKTQAKKKKKRLMERSKKVKEIDRK